MYVCMCVYICIFWAVRKFINLEGSNLSVGYMLSSHFSANIENSSAPFIIINLYMNYHLISRFYFLLPFAFSEHNLFLKWKSFAAICGTPDFAFNLELCVLQKHV